MTDSLSVPIFMWAVLRHFWGMNCSVWRPREVCPGSLHQSSLHYFWEGSWRSQVKYLQIVLKLTGGAPWVQGRSPACSLYWRSLKAKEHANQPTGHMICSQEPLPGLLPYYHTPTTLASLLLPEALSIPSSCLCTSLFPLPRCSSQDMHRWTPCVIQATAQMSPHCTLPNLCNPLPPPAPPILLFCFLYFLNCW